MVFPIMYRCESWIKKAECQRIDAFELYLEKTLESPLDSKEISQSILKSVLNIHKKADVEAPVHWPPEELTHWTRT